MKYKRDWFKYRIVPNSSSSVLDSRYIPLCISWNWKRIIYCKLLSNNETLNFGMINRAPSRIVNSQLSEKYPEPKGTALLDEISTLCRLQSSSITDTEWSRRSNFSIFILTLRYFILFVQYFSMRLPLFNCDWIFFIINIWSFIWNIRITLYNVISCYGIIIVNIWRCKYCTVIVQNWYINILILYSS